MIIHLKMILNRVESKYATYITAIVYLIPCVFGDVNIITRSEWNAKDALNPLTPLELPVGRVIIAHTAGNYCNTKETCSQEVRNIQNFHMAKLKFDDISYNYLIGNDGNVYEGRGSDHQGALARGFNAGSIGIVFMGTFTKDLPSASALEATKSLLEKLVSMQKLKEDYKLYGHNQLMATISPGDALYAEIQKWPKWSNQV